jgi:hypothetical protein
MGTKTNGHVQEAFRALAEAKADLLSVARALNDAALGIGGGDVEDALLGYVGALAGLNEAEDALKMICEPEGM